jgi:hypothetical protein
MSRPVSQGDALGWEIHGPSARQSLVDQLPTFTFRHRKEGPELCVLEIRALVEQLLSAPTHRARHRKPRGLPFRVLRLVWGHLWCRRLACPRCSGKNSRRDACTTKVADSPVSSFGIRICFGFRASHFGFPPSAKLAQYSLNWNSEPLLTNTRRPVRNCGQPAVLNRASPYASG